MAANPVLVQSGAGASTSAAPATYTQAFSQASTAGTLLVALIAYATSGAPSLTLPAGWQLATSGESAGNTIGGRIAYFANNPGAIASLAITAMSGINGIAVAFFEWSLMGLVNPQDGIAPPAASQSAYNNSGTTPGISGVTPAYGNEVWIGFECDVTGQAYTAANTPAAPGMPTWTAGTTATSTTGATNVIIRPFYAVSGPQLATTTLALKGTLAGSIANGASLVAFLSQNSAALTAAATGMGVDMLTGQAISVGGA